MTAPVDPNSITSELSQWKQGDVCLDSVDFFHVANLEFPLSEVARESRAESDEAQLPLGIEGLFTEAQGFVVLSQTCDLVRDPNKKHYLEIAPVVEVPKARLKEIQSRKWISFAYLPGVADKLLVADLDRPMTVEKTYLLGRSRLVGCRTAVEERAFAEAIGHKRSRVAFPDDFVGYFQPLQKLLKTHSRQSGPAMAFVECLDEIRVLAHPDWNNASVNLEFLFIKSTDPPDGDEGWPAMLDTWLSELQRDGVRFRLMHPQVCFLRDLDAETYVRSVPLDLESLSPP